MAAAANARGIPTTVAPFGREIRSRDRARAWQVGLLMGNSVLAHVPDLDDFVAGMKALQRCSPPTA